jgi:hypothetical protein
VGDPSLLLHVHWVDVITLGGDCATVAVLKISVWIRPLLWWGSWQNDKDCVRETFKMGAVGVLTDGGVRESEVRGHPRPPPVRRPEDALAVQVAAGQAAEGLVRRHPQRL